MVGPDTRTRFGLHSLAPTTETHRWLAGLVHLAAWCDHRKGVRVLINARADLNRTNVRGNTALHVAFDQKHHKLAELLVTHGADPKIANCEGLQPHQGLGRGVTGEVRHADKAV